MSRTTCTGTAFLLFFPDGAKSNTLAPTARSRLYTVPREHRQRVASSAIEKKCRAVTELFRPIISRTASSEQPNAEATSATENKRSEFVEQDFTYSNSNRPYRELVLQNPKFNPKPDLLSHSDAPLKIAVAPVGLTVAGLLPPTPCFT
jgi:hypothetical protein